MIISITTFVLPISSDTDTSESHFDSEEFMPQTVSKSSFIMTFI